MKPEAKKDALLIEELPGETLIYDTKRHKAFCLNRTTAAVWQKCDGGTSAEQISKSICKEFGVDRQKDPEACSDLVTLALDRLARARLLSDSTRTALPAPRYSRRELAKRLVSIGGIAALVPTVLTINAAASQTATTCVTTCNRFTLGACCCSNRRTCTSTGCDGKKC